MTAIKPPDGRSPALPVGSSGAGPHAVGGPEPAAGPSFRDELAGPGRVGAAQPGAAEATAQSVAADPIAQLAQAVRSGTLSGDEALQRLVDRAVGELARSLSPAQRAELTGVLRAALETDPTLQELRAALD